MKVVRQTAPGGMARLGASVSEKLKVILASRTFPLLSVLIFVCIVLASCRLRNEFK